MVEAHLLKTIITTVMTDLDVLVYTPILLFAAVLDPYMHHFTIFCRPRMILPIYSINFTLLVSQVNEIGVRERVVRSAVRT